MITECDEAPIDWMSALVKQQERLWSKINKLGPVAREALGPCWIYTGRIDEEGYGQFMVTSPRLPLAPRQKGMRAHRACWFLIHGATSKFLLHKCDVRSCCNPEHLFPGSQADNIADMVAKGRQAKGATHGSVSHPEAIARGERNGGGKKMDTLSVLRAVARYSFGDSHREIAREFGVSKTMIGSIMRGEAWRHVTGGPVKRATKVVT